MDKIIVQSDDFDLTTEVALAKAGNSSIGAIVSFVGTVRDLQSKNLNTMTLEHYPGMTEKSLTLIADKAREKWELESITIIHRIGTLNLNDQIVLVITMSQNRQEAFDSCNFIMDFLKTDAPFWKKESTANNEEWVEGRVKDEKQKNRWKS
ncbi:MAG: molybdenum cofactor biosynthesis protein MoaE [Thiotrichales bacterium]|jgi:molybdopterin synthase catalytic subunit|nr:molybdenum cofactor biosynthesis protein MoaE [Thiotrichales bacterium]MBT4654242.1 molybdenum cofactor biosynthesis protein MoaE [Thiotrichales bacterium]MBT5499241.1 molybdenum cofactor biosynthesis protein MoaE [Thiotrichales bacterium]MBT5984865.1 molybdenum cofactor biosynthesis protein MoaE [Thiotrichales bacterium]MBT6771432.1 molybdenum cofactor biosynthesis protein MoaE [Thiotrichales bacterium]